MELKNAYSIIIKEGFQVVGLKWTGTFAEAAAGEIRKVHNEMHQRLGEIEHVLDPDKLLGLSYQNIPGGFTHYAAVLVDRAEEIPEGMEAVTVPASAYARYEHAKGQDISESYSRIYAWIEGQGYKPNVGEYTHLEEYPMQQDPFTPDPEFVIMIPIEK
ncbi:GyrI-like domain-containing protein [Paenibacillus sp. J22TS3]|uniref:GyrI-like domain-containing protein n=1 Tax=Paenibacillus sp. J22TS3 TaxID=2807192 RepID=UPI001B2D272D|nr:effector binding domain-containing protein [Paenibacillus sp. J22TS3]GIP22119.1 hypothetical protein J22TS3_23940 [Paenibacillus sp. J22TS3]